MYIPLIKDFLKDTLHLLDRDGEASNGKKFGGLPYDRAKTEIDKSLNGVLDSANRIKRIVDDLKNFSRQDSIDMSEIVDINSSVQTAVRLTTNLIKKSTDNQKNRIGW